MFYPTLEGPALIAYEKMCAELKSKAMRELGLGPDQIILRPLRANDLGFSSESGFAVLVTGSAVGAAGWSATNLVTNIANGRWVGINGIATNETAGVLTEVKVTREGSDARYWSVANIPSFEEHTGYVDDPVTIDQNTNVTISCYGRTAGTLTQTVFMGAVAEKKGIVINP